MNWKGLVERKVKAPWVPTLKGVTDRTRFSSNYNNEREIARENDEMRRRREEGGEDVLSPRRRGARRPALGGAGLLAEITMAAQPGRLDHPAERLLAPPAAGLAGVKDHGQYYETEPFVLHRSSKSNRKIKKKQPIEKKPQLGKFVRRQA